ncbi:carbohydrate ABC transporter permease [Paenibacillus mucilaginosus]|uniref:Binding-protein-dependent transport systems inner membrane component n=3 Tax=Paenibacillus mucilaginosus TaxID=61624 RepID=H6NCW6_9BACL|nr:carbohydrate ABC transporter permease [Paenibacillus mucilaginosus]AEI40857.1 binding-protein-dependent transport systems inner membrane component [Paenibacillus mucilaginosus KNP414]AFC29448.1 binding-protein-dependent transport systems inner membrane component [Paenibacillus mucilaginosus 3016]AFH61625.1 sugar ABC transporter permease [Paenibacillus mucilaginosus K02]MCG7211677.1 carbohydrate ABC transporter permease [Paenibacillus mucilaginosus]WDM29966.1 carbohydrate ABC transporter per
MKNHAALRAAAHLVLLAGAVTMILPFLWTVSTSLKQLSEVFVFPPKPFGAELQWGNYLRISERFPFDTYFFNSVKITLIVVAAQLVTSSMAGFVFARLRFRGRDLLFGLYLATMMVPAQVTMIPNFIVMRSYNLVDTHWALILPALVSAFGTFLLRQFFVTIPESLEDAAKIDGCTPFGIYWRIFIPLSKPAMATLGVFVFMGTWNDFIAPLVYINSVDLMTLPLGLASMQGMYSTDWPVLMAGTVICILPLIVIFLLAQDFFIKGVTLSGLKGE